MCFLLGHDRKQTLIIDMGLCKEVHLKEVLKY